jgi:hypothetical protein
VTPEPFGDDLSGHILVRMQTEGSLDFNGLTYMIAVDTCASGVPYPQAAFTGYKSYSYAFLLGAGGGVAVPVLYQYYLNGGTLTYVPINDLAPSTTQFVANSNGAGTQFELIFLRADLDNPDNIANPCPNGNAPLTTWTFNLMTYQNRVPLDSLGPQSSVDASFGGIVVDTTATDVQPFQRSLAGVVGLPSNPSAVITYGEVDNYL